MSEPTPAPVPPPAPATPGTPPLRAFAQGTGVMLQAVGVILFLSTCCICSFAGKWEPPMERMETKEKHEQQKITVPTLDRLFDSPAKAGLSLMVVFSTVGGLALAVFGLGLQSDKPFAAYAAVTTAALWLLVLIVAGVCLWIGGASWFVKLWNIIFALLAMIVLGFTIGALKQIIKHPPPRGLEILPPDFEIPKFKH